MHSINIFQKNWAFTSAENAKPQIKTGSFGPCYVVTFTSQKFAAMAHIDDMTQVDSIEIIFNKFSENSIELKDVKVIILGGWKAHPESFKWGNKIVEKIKTAGFKNISDKNMFSKKCLTLLQQMQDISGPELPTYFHFGALVDATNGKTFLLKEPDGDLDNEQTRQMEEFVNKYGYTMNEELPISQITS